ncbi:GTPase Der [Porphyridium purpureum]|uniref:GTPase Der n=1 Tax=Porphyridium purpureum TaxID=35688 RepID=A0A5J4YIU1_PORPP|nr:GTPase Der [Porphyridium purpureum]|eukprot:POR4762..scf297_16
MRQSAMLLRRALSIIRQSRGAREHASSYRTRRVGAQPSAPHRRLGTRRTFTTDTDVNASRISSSSVESPAAGEGEASLKDEELDALLMDPVLDFEDGTLQAGDGQQAADQIGDEAYSEAKIDGREGGGVAPSEYDEPAAQERKGTNVTAPLDREQQKRAKRLGRAQRERLVDLGLKIAIVGRPNAGKSTLYNRLSDMGQKWSNKSLVSPMPGVTRDTFATNAALGDLRFTLLDTAGIETIDPTRFMSMQFRQSQQPLRTSKGRNPGNARTRGSGGGGSMVIRRATAERLDPFADESVAASGALTESDVYRALYKDMARKTKEAVLRADLVFFMFDAKVGVTPIDVEIGAWLRTVMGKGYESKIIVLANKVDAMQGALNVAEAYELGLGHPIPISALHSDGLIDLFQRMDQYRELGREMQAKSFSSPIGKVFDFTTKPVSTKIRADADADASKVEDARELEEDTWDDLPIVAIVGRPNVGKSTLMNSLLKQDRVLTGPAPGVTRDAVRELWCHDGTNFLLVDTAGLRRRHKYSGPLEQNSASSSFQAIRRSNVVVLVLDATEGPTDYDQRIAQTIAEEGKSLIVVLNKMDLLPEEDRKHALKEIQQAMRSKFPALKGAPVIPTSAIQLSEKEADRVSDEIEGIYGRWNRYVPVPRLMEWLQEYCKLTPPQRASSSVPPPKLRFIKQTARRPPTFVILGSSVASNRLIASLENSIRANFDFAGVPVRVRFRAKMPNPSTRASKRLKTSLGLAAAKQGAAAQKSG